jgi:hypothetical protein
MKKIFVIALLSLMLTPAAGAQDIQKINKKNLVIKEWNTDPKGGNKTLDHVTTYNADGEKIEEIEYSGSKQKWRKRFEYGSNGKVSRELVYNEKNRLQTYKTFEYNEFLRKKVQYTYNAKGKLLSVKHFEYIAQDAGN